MTYLRLIFKFRNRSVQITFMDDIPSIFFLQLINDFLQLAGFLVSCVPQAELTYWSADSADANSDQPHGLIWLADSFHELDGGTIYFIIVVSGCGQCGLSGQCGKVRPANFQFDSFSSEIIFAELPANLHGLFAQGFFQCPIVTNIDVECDFLTDGLGFGFSHDKTIVNSI
jgi:hypothetical protein